MNHLGPVERVVKLLIESGYARLNSPIAVAGVPFEFDAVLVGNERAYDLVVVVDTALSTNRRLRQQIDALGRALDVAGSLRPLSVVTVGPSPSPEVLEMMSRTARVLVVRADGQGDNIKDALAVLLPLIVPPASAGSSEALSVVSAWADASADPEGLRYLISAAAEGESAVSKALADYLDEPFVVLTKEDT